MVKNCEIFTYFLYLLADISGSVQLQVTMIVAQRRLDSFVSHYVRF